MNYKTNSESIYGLDVIMTRDFYQIPPIQDS